MVCSTKDKVRFNLEQPTWSFKIFHSLRNIYCIQGTVIGTGDTFLRRRDSIPAFMELVQRMRHKFISQITIFLHTVRRKNKGVMRYVNI